MGIITPILEEDLFRKMNLLNISTRNKKQIYVSFDKYASV